METSQIQFDENKTIEQLWREGKLGASDYTDFVLGIDTFSKETLYKIPIDQIISIACYSYTTDASVAPLIITGTHCSAYHKGRRTCDTITKETFNHLVNRQKREKLSFFVSHYLVDMSDPIEQRYAYRLEDDTNIKEFRRQVSRSRNDRLKESKPDKTIVALEERLQEKEEAAKRQRVKVKKTNFVREPKSFKRR